MIAKAIGGNSVSDLDKHIKLALENPTFQPNLAILFCDPRFDLVQLAQLFREYKIELCGSTTAGEILDQHVVEESIVVLLLSLPPNSFEVFFEDNSKGHTESLAMDIGRKANKRYENPSLVILSSGLDTDGEAIVKGVTQSLEPFPKIFGGLAGDNLEMRATYVFNSSQTSAKGVAGVIFDHDQVELIGIAASGWKGLG